jgi:predicted O-linked N-acetylglucosamine transferase (SPINDLY family)
MFGWFKSSSPKKDATGYESALPLDTFDDLLNKGNQLLGDGKLKDAISNYRQAIAIRPDNVSAHINLAYALVDDGSPEEARSHLELAIRLDSMNADACYMLGKLSRHDGETGRAIALIEKAIALNLDYEYAYSELFELYMEKGDISSAIKIIEQGICKHPNIAHFYSCLGDAWATKSELDKALAAYQRALVWNPKSYQGHNGLGIIYLEQRNWSLAAKHFQKAIAIDATQVDAYCNLGIAYEKRGDLLDAIEQFEKAYANSPDAYPVINNLANAYRVMGRNAEAIALRRILVEKHPTDENARDSLLFDLSYFPNSSPEAYLQEAIQYGRVLAKNARPFSHWLVETGGTMQEKLRIGFVTGDLCNHPVGFFLESVISHLPRNHLELIAYPTMGEEDQLTRRIRPQFNEWHCLAGLSDEAAASQIYADRIHILIDLSGHTKLNRLPVFSWQPAPVQISWLGYFATTGVAEISYLLADRIAVTEEMQPYFSESIRYLHDTRLCFSPPDINVEISPLPASKRGYVTFGSFQGLTKITEEVLRLWAEVLQALPSARLRVQSMYLGFPKMDKYLLERMARAGVDIARVSLHPSDTRDNYLAAHSEIDIILDTFPYTGGTTTCEALWMGVPTVTLQGNTMLSRQGASLLTYAGLKEWVALSPQDYLEIAVAYARDIEELSELRKNLRDRIKSSPICDAISFSANLAERLVEIWMDHKIK